MIYLDHNATTTLRPGVLDAMLPWLRDHQGNASSVHRAGRLARQAVEQAREQVAAWLQADPAEVIFTSGATEANNWALAGLCAGQPRAVGSTEHDAVLEAVPAAPRLAVDADGVLQPQALAAWLQGRTPGLLSLMWANNETGVLYDLPALTRVAAEQGWSVHTDATQIVGRARIDFARSGVAALSCSAHKLGGPKGVGALVLRSGTAIARGQRGGPHERKLRAGTLNVPGIVGFGAACAHLQTACADEAEQQRQWRDAFEADLLRTCPGAEVFGADAPRLPNTSFFRLPDWHSEALLMALDRQGFALASGSACHSGAGTPSHVLVAMQVATERALGAVRMSLGHDSQPSDAPSLLSTLGDIIQATPVASSGLFNR